MGSSRSSLRLKDAVRLRLLGGFEVVRGGASIQLPLGAQRLIAFVALRPRPVRREYAAGMLWIDSSDERAAANLRSTLWRIQKRVRGLIVTTDGRLRLGSGVEIDLRLAEQVAQDILGGSLGGDVDLLRADVLPDWYEDWVQTERERFRQLRLSAIETLCDRHASEGRLGEALELGLLSVAAEPLRESAHRALIRVHLATGNAAEAIRQYGACRRLLNEQLGIEPTEQLTALIDGLGPS